MYGLQHGTGQPHVYKEELREVTIPLPEIDTQQKIVDKIVNYQNERKKAEELTEGYKQKIETIIKDIF
ncbi:restriction endonuclease subunit S [Lactococcus lactis]|uniref:Restriction endonuclease subunit S n=1 Tax=Lactococcus lactis TaxID=1358 RepID=A0AAP3Z2I4_9LACT|nr:restriction endonuclease subunit S [Lactococcus lactis]MDG4969240.1 restriction endonuclease subunit S [Lactococcus lactis]MDG4977171.1 restriction endonuclease subunit S [Lactococcus lactis]MDG5103334.1 restriction endonuclease subunit S [Lactococcus lactis]